MAETDLRALLGVMAWTVALAFAASQGSLESRETQGCLDPQGMTDSRDFPGSRGSMVAMAPKAPRESKDHRGRRASRFWCRTSRRSRRASQDRQGRQARRAKRAVRVPEARMGRTEQTGPTARMGKTANPVSQVLLGIPVRPGSQAPEIRGRPGSLEPKALLGLLVRLVRRVRMADPASQVPLVLRERRAPRGRTTRSPALSGAWARPGRRAWMERGGTLVPRDRRGSLDQMAQLEPRDGPVRPKRMASPGCKARLASSAHRGPPAGMALRARRVRRGRRATVVMWT